MGCTLPEKKKETIVSKKPDTTVIQSNDVNTASADTLGSVSLPVIKQIKSPGGIYQTVLPLKNKVEQTIAFNSDLTFQLQEKYFNEGKDSMVTTEGTWTPSDGFIWLYKDQIERGRYKWKGNTLQYYNPVVKKSFSMRHLQDAMQNKAWKNKEKQGIILFGTGNEPFWHIEVDNKDSISFLLPDWDQPLKLKVTSSFDGKDSTEYVGKADSTQLRVTIFPHFCSDGMSDFTYRNKVSVQLNKEVYNGCGILFRR